MYRAGGGSTASNCEGFMIEGVGRSVGGGRSMGAGRLVEAGLRCVFGPSLFFNKEKPERQELLADMIRCGSLGPWEIFRYL